MITLYKTFETVDDEDLCSIIYDYGFNNNYDFILNKVGEIPRTPEYVQRDGYTILGWYTEPELTTEYDFSQPIQGDVHLYARLISYDNVASVYTYMPDEFFYTDCYETEKGNTVYIPDPELEGMYFDGWYTNSEKTIKYDDTAPITSDIELYAKFVPDVYVALEAPSSEPSLILVCVETVRPQLSY